MNRRFVAVLAFALVVSAIATLLFYRLISARLASSPKVVVTEVLVAARTMPVGTLIRDADVKTASWPGSIPQGAILKKEDALNRGVVASIYENELLIESRLAPKGAGAGLAATIPTGKRAVAVRVNEVVGVAGFVVPGMRVDVLISGMPPGAPQNLGTQSKTLLQNIEVLSAGQNIQKDAEGKPITVPVVNLLVTPEQAEILSLAGSATSIQLVLRNPMDTEIAKTPGTAVARLFSGQTLGLPKPAGAKPVVRRLPVVAPPPQVKKEAPPPIVVEVLHGKTKAETTFKPTPEEKP